MHPTTDALPGGRREISPGRLLSPEDEDHRKHGRDGQTLQHRGGVIAGGRGIRGDGVWPEQAGKRAAPGDGATASSLITHAPSAAQSCTFRSWHGNEILRKREACSERST